MVVIGDIHGNYKTLLALLAQLPKDQKVCLVGDLVDRGPASRQVIQYVIDNKIDCVMGNHEWMMLDWKGALHSEDLWLGNGGSNTLDSYCSPIDGTLDLKTFEQHREFLSTLPLILAYPEVKNAEGRFLVVSHSSCGKVWRWDEKKREEQTMHFEEIVLWGRSAPADAQEIYNVFGHTIQRDGPRIKVPFAIVDTGAYKIWDEKCGYLTGLQFPEMTVYIQKNIDLPEPVQLEDE